MSTFVPATNTIRVAVEYNQSGHLSVNVYHVLSPHAIVSADLTSIASVFATWIGSTLIPLVTASWSAYNINARDLTTSSGIILDTPLTSGNTGTHSGSPAPNSTALVTSWRTGRAGRSFRGRTYLGSIPQGVISSTGDNLVTTGYAASVASAMSTLQGAIATAGYSLVVASFRSGGAARTSAVLTAPTSLIVNTKLDTTRGRMKGAD